MADIDRRDMDGTAFQQHLREAAGGGADIERLAAARIESEMVEPGDQLQRGTRDIAARRVVHRQLRPGRDALSGLRHHRTVDRDGATLDSVAGA